MNTRVKCYKVLPVVYDDSLSYYEQLCKIREKLNELIKAVQGDISDLIEAYFNELMIDAIYDESTETITLKKEVSITGYTHTYSADNKEMVIK